MQFGEECDPIQYENKVGTTKKIHSLNFQNENSLKGVQKPSQNDHLPINVTCYNANLKGSEKTRGPDLAHSL